MARRLPTLRSRAAAEPLMPPDAANHYPALTADLDDIKATVFPAFARLDVEAGLAQNRHRRARLVILLGGAVSTILGAIAGASEDLAWPGAAGSVVGGLLFVFGLMAGRAKDGERFLRSRLGAELLRGEAFRYLARAAPYVDGDRREQLKTRVAAIANEVGE